MRKYLVFLGLLALGGASFLLSLLYFSNPQYRKEKIDSYKQKMERRMQR